MEHAPHINSVQAALWLHHFVLAKGENLLEVIGLFSMSGLFKRKRTQKGFSAEIGLPIW